MRRMEARGVVQCGHIYQIRPDLVTAYVLRTSLVVAFAVARITEYTKTVYGVDTK